MAHLRVPTNVEVASFVLEDIHDHIFPLLDQILHVHFLLAFPRKCNEYVGEALVLAVLGELILVDEVRGALPAPEEQVRRPKLFPRVRFHLHAPLLHKSDEWDHSSAWPDHDHRGLLLLRHQKSGLLDEDPIREHFIRVLLELLIDFFEVDGGEAHFAFATGQDVSGQRDGDPDLLWVQKVAGSYRVVTRHDPGSKLEEGFEVEF
mmetsp:Transcript_35842/g.34881  ORF Transcript_35842/g.34881 Transcript_35842/m.34881 type:complete len:205 (-) Transcript_35842:1336-1950(-)